MCQDPFIRMCVRSISAARKGHEEMLASGGDAFHGPADEGCVGVHARQMHQGRFESGNGLSSQRAVECARGFEYRVSFRHVASSGAGVRYQ